MNTSRKTWESEEDLQDLDSASVIAVNVIKQAFRDLEPHYVTTKDQIDDFQSQRTDAYDFLTCRLWDPECLWLELLGHCLVKREVLQEVEKRLENATPHI